MRYSRKITIINITPPKIEDVNHDLQYFGTSLGLFGLRDKDRSCYRVFVELLKAAKMKAGLTSDELAFCLDLSRGTVVHHLNKLMDAGICIRSRGRYFLREDNLQVVVEELKKDLDENMKNLMHVAKEIDQWMGI